MEMKTTSVMKNKLIFLGIMIATLVLVPATILPSVNLAFTLKHLPSILNLLQRFIGLILFVLVFWQIMLGAYMEKLYEKFGNWIFDFHVWEGITIYLLAIVHPLIFLTYRHYTGVGTDPVFVFLGFCGYCQTNLDFYYTLGRIGFWLLTIAVFAGLFRSSTTFLKKNWRKFHVINYLVFIGIGIHGFLLGSDFSFPPFIYFAILASLLVLYTVLRKLPNLIFSYRKWINS